MRKTFMAGAAALALAFGTHAVSAQDAGSSTSSGTISAQQQSAYDSWPADRQSSYDSWSADIKSYFWSLTVSQQEGWWALTDAQRQQVFALTPEQRKQAWTSIEAQLAGAAAPTGSARAEAGTDASPPSAAATGTTRGMDSANPADSAGPDANVGADGVPNPATAGSAVPPAMPADPSYQGEPYHGAATPPPAEAMNKEYPVCTREIQDSCRNRGGV